MRRDSVERRNKERPLTCPKCGVTPKPFFDCRGKKLPRIYGRIIPATGELIWRCQKCCLQEKGQKLRYDQTVVRTLA